MCFFFSSRRRHTRSLRDWSSDVCSSDLSKDLIISSGYNVYPRMIEEAVYEHPAVDECIVIGRSEEHTSELQSRRDLVCRLLLEKKKLRPADLTRDIHQHVVKCAAVACAA